MNQLLALSNTGLDYPLPVIIFNILFALFLGILLALVYQKTHKGLSYSASFTFTLVLLTAAGSILMMIVGNSLARAFSLFGAFSIIRFRTAVKDAKDIAFVFITLITGMAVGTNNYTIAIVSTALIIAAIFFLTRRRFGNISAVDHLLTFYLPANQSTDRLLKIFQKQLEFHQLVNLSSYKESKQVEMAYNIKLKPQVRPQDFLLELKELKQLENIRLVSLEENLLN
jgi:uncharacterized membrane protein YhiD involved in acid resistance